MQRWVTGPELLKPQLRASDPPFLYHRAPGRSLLLMKDCLPASRQFAVRQGTFTGGRLFITLLLPHFIYATYSEYVSTLLPEVSLPMPSLQGNLYLPKDKDDLKVELEKLVSGSFLTFAP